VIFDIHVHTSLSPCSVLPLEDILDQASGLGLDGVCITDHDTMEAARFVREGRQKDGLIVLVGMEYSTPQGQFLIFGPFDGMRPGLSGRKLLKRVHDAGGAAVAAHPCRGIRPVDDGLLDLCHAVETFNGGNRHSENIDACQAAERHGLPGIGASDAHHLGALGRIVSESSVDIETRGDLVRAIRNGLLLSETPCP
jgi:hypothetical protein